MRRVIPITLLVSSSLLVLATDGGAAQRPTRGYLARACSFDLDGDGIVGEPIDDCRLCDGVTLDPDGDGVNEDLIYIDADSGNDTTGNGSPQNPYRTIRHAWGVADGPGDGAEDILCFRGSAREQGITPEVSGVPGVDVKPRSGSEARDFEFPSDPTMLVGWDTDRDGCYPPYDDGVTDVGSCGTDADVAVLDGAGLGRAFELARSGGSNNRGVRYLEMAHFAVRDYGFQIAGTEDNGFVAYGRGEESSHIYLHDIELDNINRGKVLESSSPVFNFFIGGMRFSYVAMVNIAARNVGGYFARGDFGGHSNFEGPVRFQNIGYLGFGCSKDVCGTSGDDATVTAFKLWGTIDGLEVLDSVFDTNSPVWTPRIGGPIGGVVANACSKDWAVRNNLFRNWRTTLIVKGSDSTCGLRATDDVLFDSNIVVVDDEVTYSGGPTGATGVSLGDDGSSSPNNSIADVTVVNNFFYSKVGWLHALVSSAGNYQSPGPGTVVFAGNTVHGSPVSGNSGLVHLRVGDGGSITFPLPRFRIENNIFTGFRLSANPKDSLSLNFEYQPSQLLAVTHNTFDPAAAYRWLGTDYVDLAQWRSATGMDSSSRACVPNLVDPDLGDLHLSSADTCAKDVGGDISAFTSVDIDLDMRPVDGSMRAGADGVAGIFIFADGFESGDTSAW